MKIFYILSIEIANFSGKNLIKCTEYFSFALVQFFYSVFFCSNKCILQMWNSHTWIELPQIDPFVASTRISQIYSTFSNQSIDKFSSWKLASNVEVFDKLSYFSHVKNNIHMIGFHQITQNIIIRHLPWLLPSKCWLRAAIYSIHGSNNYIT